MHFLCLLYYYYCYHIGIAVLISQIKHCNQLRFKIHSEKVNILKQVRMLEDNTDSREQTHIANKY
jgi:hypothetical protein